MRLRKLLLALLLTVQCAALPALCEGEYYGSYPADDVYLTQTAKHTCTLVAATMMLRNFACQRGTPYLPVTETGVRRVAWSKQYGLAQEFTLGQVDVSCSADIRSVEDRKLYLIQSLQAHKEGVVIYDTGAPHAVWLFGYDEDADTFWCADTINSRGGHAIPLEEASIRGETQQDKIDTIDKIWFVVEKRYDL